MKIETEERRKLSINNKKHIGRKSNTILQFRTLTHYRNRRIRSYYKSHTLTKRRTNNIQVKDYKLDETKL